MREILFRGKRVYNGEWVKGHGIHYGTNFVEIFTKAKEGSLYGERIHVTPETVGQFTGLTDKNGVKIFEGDVCENEVRERGLIMYGDGTFYLSYFEEPANNYLFSFVQTDKDYNSTGVCNIK